MRINLKSINIKTLYLTCLAMISIVSPSYCQTYELIDQFQFQANNHFTFSSIESKITQSFIANKTNNTGITILLRSGSGSTNLTISLWDGLPENPSSNMLASDLITAEPWNFVRAKWNPIPLSVGSTYYFQTTSSNGSFQIKVDDQNSYPSGVVFTGNSFAAQPDDDLNFKTHYIDSTLTSDPNDGYCDTLPRKSTVWIEKIELQSLLNENSGASGYWNYPESITTTALEQNRNYSITVETSSNILTHKYEAVFLDANQDGEFTSDEKIGQWDHSGLSGSIPIYIPHDALLGTTRLRIVLRYVEGGSTGFSNVPEACYFLDNGEIEDYTIEILPSTTILPDTIINLFSSSGNIIGSSPFSYRIPALATTNTGRLIAVCDARYGTTADLPNDIDLVIRKSDDNGDTWSPRETIVNSGLIGSGDPQILIDKETGDIFIFYAYKVGWTSPVDEIRYIKSTDNGDTWSAPINIKSMIFDPSGINMWAGPSNGIQMRNGRLVAPFSLNAIGPVDSIQSCFIYSDDHGLTWQRSVSPTGTGLEEPTIVELNSGDLMINARSRRGVARRAITYTQGNGVNWTATWDHPDLWDPIVQGSCIRYTSIIDGYAKDRLLFSNPRHMSNRENLSVYLSYDEGNTWSWYKVLDPNGSAYSSMTILDNGDIGILYERDYGPHGVFGIIYPNHISFARFTLKELTNGADSIILCTMPNAPTIQYISSDSVDIIWEEITGVGFYSIEYKLQSASFWNSIDSASSSYTLHNLLPNQVYDVRLIWNCSDSSVLASETIQFCMPPISPVISNISNSEADVNWVDTTGGVYYLEYKPAFSGTWIRIDSVNSPITLNGLSPNEIYDIRLIWNCSDSIISISDVTQFCTAPNAPILFTIFQTEAEISWAGTTGAHYSLEYKPESSSSWIQLDSVFPPMVLTGLSPDENYTVQLIWHCEDSVSTISEEVQFSTLTSGIIGNDLPDLNIYPNPGCQNIFIEGLEVGYNDLIIHITTIDGKVLFKEHFSSYQPTIEIDIPTVKNEIVFLKLTSGKTQITKKLFLKWNCN